MGAQFTVPLITVIPGQLIASTLWNNEWANINTNFIPAGMDSYSDTDAQMQIQTAPYPGSVTSHASNLGGEIERIRYQISAMLGVTTPAFWYAKPPIDLITLSNITMPIGSVFDYPSATPPNSNYLLANGQAIGRVAYASLFTLISTTFGSGDGTTTFNIPNYTDRMAITAGNLYSLAATGGATTHTLTQAEAPSGLLTLNDPGHFHTATSTDSGHIHNITDAGHTHTPRQNTAGSAGSSVGGTSTTITPANFANGPTVSNATTGITINSGTANISTTVNPVSTGANLSDHGGNTAHSILNPYLSMYKLIRVL